MTLESSLVRCWYARRGWCRLLIPLSWLFIALSRLRRRLYAWGWLRSVRLPVPVIVVGNLNVGGSGKTPLVIWLTERLQARGYHPAVVSRGYGGRRAEEICEVGVQSDPALCGDEPVLLARRTGCPVWVGRDRAQAGRRLLARYPEVDVIVSDDGLQHYALARDLEIVVVDGRRLFGNGLCLPAGPLREGPGRLERVDAVVINGEGGLPGQSAYRMSLEVSGFVALHDPVRKVGADYFYGRSVHALAGIGDPERFFRTLSGLGVSVVPHPFPDHHAYRQEDLPQDTLIMTEKDAVKCAVYAPPDAWVLTVDARLSEGLESLILNKLESRHGQQAA